MKTVTILLLSLVFTLAQQVPIAVPAWPATPATFVEDTPKVQPSELSDKQQAYQVLKDMGRGGEYWCLHNIFQRESSWDKDAVGDSGRSFGLPQRHSPVHGTPELPWPLLQQVEWAVQYADSRYGNLCAAWEEWQRKGWW